MQEEKTKEYYQEKIVEIVRDIENCKYLEFLYNLMLSFQKKYNI